MLNIKDYEERIISLHSQGMTGKQIVDILQFKNHQPVYNYFRKRGWPITGKITKKKYHLMNGLLLLLDLKEKN